MNIGMLWYIVDTDKKDSLEDNIRKAAKYYFNKYEKLPNTVYINPNMVTLDTQNMLDGMEIRTTNSVLPYHMWMGIDEEI